MLLSKLGEPCFLGTGPPTMTDTLSKRLLVPCPQRPVWVASQPSAIPMPSTTRGGSGPKSMRTWPAWARTSLTHTGFFHQVAKWEVWQGGTRKTLQSQEGWAEQATSILGQRCIHAADCVPILCSESSKARSH